MPSAARTEFATDGTLNEQTKTGGWAVVVHKQWTGTKPGSSSFEMELRAVTEAVKLAEGSATVVCDHEAIVHCARRVQNEPGYLPVKCREVWEELAGALRGKDVEFEWRVRDKTFGQHVAHQAARTAVRGR